MKLTIELVERFHEKWRLNEENGCWEWIGATAGRGYGFLKKPGERHQIYAHRLSYLIHYGELPDDKMVCHACDNVKCVKPSHLFLGTGQENLSDMKNKDRHLRGARNKMAKLDDDKVRQMHKLREQGVSQGRIASIYGVTQGVTWRILNGQSWEHIYREIMARAKG